MTLSDFIKENWKPLRAYAVSWLDDYSRRAGELAAYNADRGGSGELTQADREYLDANFDIKDKAQDVAFRVLRAFKDNMKDQPFETFTAQDIDTMATLFPPRWSEDTKRGMYETIQERMQGWEYNDDKPISVDHTFLTNVLNYSQFVDRWTIKKLEEAKTPEPIIQQAMKLSGMNKDRALTALMDNPSVKKPQAAEVFLNLATKPDVNDNAQTVFSIMKKLGDDGFDAELQKLPVTAPIFYNNRFKTDLSKRSDEEIKQHLNGRDELVRANGGEANFGSKFNYTPFVNTSIFDSPIFSLDHLKMWPEGENLSYEDMNKLSKIPKLSAVMGHEELFPFIGKLTGDNDFYYDDAKRMYSHMVDLSHTNGRPHDLVARKYDSGWFEKLSHNPTFVADTEDLPHMFDTGHYGMVDPERMSPKLRQYFEDIKPALDGISKSQDYSDERQAALNEFVDVTEGAQDSRDFMDYHWRNLLPLMSHYDPEYTKNWINNANTDSFELLLGALSGIDSTAYMHPSVLNGIKTKRLYDIHENSRLGLRGLTDETQQRLREGFRSIIPEIDKHFSHFHERTGEDLTFKAAEFDALDEYMAHAAKNSKHQLLQVKRGSGTLRALRDFLEQAYRDRGVSSMNPRDLPKDRVWNSVYQTLVTKNKDGSTTESRTIDWNPLRGKDGNVSAETVQAHIDRMKPVGVNVTEAKWTGAQRHNLQNSNVVVFGMTNDHVSKLKSAGLWEDFKKVSASLPRGHPQHPLALGWVRYTLPNPSNSHDGHVFVDEVQNDIVKQLGSNTSISDGNKKKIMDILYDGSHPSDLLHEAFHEFARSKKWHDRPFTIHSPESKRPISLSDQTGPVPIHYKKTYEEIIKQRFHVEPAKYGERPDETHQGIQGKPVWTGTIRKFEDMIAIPVNNGYSDWE